MLPRFALQAAALYTANELRGCLNAMDRRGTEDIQSMTKLQAERKTRRRQTTTTPWGASQSILPTQHQWPEAPSQQHQPPHQQTHKHHHHQQQQGEKDQQQQKQRPHQHSLSRKRREVCHRENSSQTTLKDYLALKKENKIANRHPNDSETPRQRDERDPWLSNAISTASQTQTQMQNAKDLKDHPCAFPLEMARRFNDTPGKSNSNNVTNQRPRITIAIPRGGQTQNKHEPVSNIPTSLDNCCSARILEAVNGTKNSTQDSTFVGLENKLQWRDRNDKISAPLGLQCVQYNPSFSGNSLITPQSTGDSNKVMIFFPGSAVPGKTRNKLETDPIVPSSIQEIGEWRHNAKTSRRNRANQPPVRVESLVSESGVTAHSTSSDDRSSSQRLSDLVYDINALSETKFPPVNTTDNKREKTFSFPMASTDTIGIKTGELSSTESLHSNFLGNEPIIGDNVYQYYVNGLNVNNGPTLKSTSRLSNISQPCLPVSTEFYQDLKATQHTRIPSVRVPEQRLSEILKACTIPNHGHFSEESEMLQKRKFLEKTTAQSEAFHNSNEFFRQSRQHFNSGTKTPSVIGDRLVPTSSIQSKQHDGFVFLATKELSSSDFDKSTSCSIYTVKSDEWNTLHKTRGYNPVGSAVPLDGFKWKSRISDVRSQSGSRISERMGKDGESCGVPFEQMTRTEPSTFEKTATATRPLGQSEERGIFGRPLFVGQDTMQRFLPVNQKESSVQGLELDRFQNLISPDLQKASMADRSYHPLLDLNNSTKTGTGSQLHAHDQSRNYVKMAEVNHCMRIRDESPTYANYEAVNVIKIKDLSHNLHLTEGTFPYQAKRSQMISSSFFENSISSTEKVANSSNPSVGTHCEIGPISKDLPWPPYTSETRSIAYKANCYAKRSYHNLSNRLPVPKVCQRYPSTSYADAFTQENGGGESKEEHDKRFATPASELLCSVAKVPFPNDAPASTREDSKTPFNPSITRSNYEYREADNRYFKFANEESGELTGSNGPRNMSYIKIRGSSYDITSNAPNFSHAGLNKSSEWGNADISTIYNGSGYHPFGTHAAINRDVLSLGKGGEDARSKQEETHNKEADSVSGATSSAVTEKTVGPLAPSSQPKSVSTSAFAWPAYKAYNTCPVCCRIFTRSWLLKGHMRTHTGERPFRCSFPSCGKAFADKSNLRSHTLIHTANTKSFTCHNCGRAFSQKRYLHKHMMEVCRTAV